jgi:flagellar biosynthesis protein FlhF
MHLKRFRSNNVRDALRMVRDELGPNALVLSTAMVQARGWRGLMGAREVEITAATDREVSAPRPEVSADRQADRQAERPPAPAAAPMDHITAQLVATGMDRDIADQVVASIPARSRRTATPARLRDALAARLASLAAPSAAFARAEVFVGPPGAGKTTTIAKIAAQERARGGQRLGLIAADGFRVGAVEQLQTYADILDAPFRVARTPEDLSAALAAKQRVPVLVDTAGRSPSDPASRELFAVVGASEGVRTHLVLPAGTPARAARRIFDGYADARPSRLVLTKLDEAESLSPLVSLLHEWQLPISYVGTGQRVPDDLNLATAELLAASVLGESAPLSQNLS